MRIEQQAYVDPYGNGEFKHIRECTQEEIALLAKRHEVEAEKAAAEAEALLVALLSDGVAGDGGAAQ